VKPSRRSTLRRALRVLGTLSLLALTAVWVDVEAVAGELARAEPLPLVLALALSVPLVLVLAGRWSFTARRMGVDMPFSVAVGEYYVSTLLNKVLPGGVLGDVGRAMRGSMRNPDAKGVAVRSVVLERVSGQVALWSIVGVGLLVWGADAGLRVASVLGGVLAFVVVVVVLAPRVPGVADSRLGRAWATVMEEARLSFVDRGAWAVQLSLSLLSVVILMATYAACAAAVGVVAEANQLLLIAPVLLAVSSLPLSVGGWGIREVTSAALFEMTGLDPAAGVAASAAFGAINLVASLPGVLVLLRRPTPAKPEEDHEHQAAP
jgi:uncharacterized membrane protein YbhN (UPF0104 family)